MVVGAAAGFSVFGHLSDRLGRRRIIVPALLVGILSSVVLASWPALPGLIVGRVLTGVAVGLMASSATTYLTDLYAAGAGRRRCVDILSGSAARLLKECGRPGCTQVYTDHSRGSRREWCSAKCRNKVNVAAYRTRVRERRP